MKKIHGIHVLIFLMLTFALSWGFDWVILSAAGVQPYGNLGMHPWGMLVSAFVALMLQMFFYKNSPVYYRVYRDKSRWIFFSFFLVVILHGILTVFAVMHPEEKTLFQGAGALLYTLWTLLVFFLYSQSDQATLEQVGLRLKNLRTGQLFIFGILGFFLIQVAGNLVFDLGTTVTQPDRIYGLPLPSFLYIPVLIVLFLPVTVIGIPLSGLAGVFGEEYGWRGFLQSGLIQLGKLKGIVLVGLIWGIWHFPVILRGSHTYPASTTGLVLGIIFFVLWGIVLGYAVLKTGNIWIAAFMHGVVNSVYGFMLTYIVKHDNPILSFGLGIYGLLCLGVIVLFIIRDPI